jgi:hypothetical protein
MNQSIPAAAVSSVGEALVGAPVRAAGRSLSELMGHRGFRFLASGWLNPFLVVRITKAP